MAGESKLCVHCNKVIYRTKEASNAWARRTTCSHKCSDAAYAGKRRKERQEFREKIDKPIINLTDPMDRWLYRHAP
jgi:hypothetical protein